MINIIIPTYNNKDTLTRTLSSISAQTNSKRIITTVIDDCSSEDISAIIELFKNVITINCAKLEKNLGKPGLVRQYGIDRTNCDYIMFLDADDVLAPNAVEILNNAIRQDGYEYINSAFYQQHNGKFDVIPPHQITWLHGNIYNRKFLEKWDIRFDDRLNEDGSFNFKCFWLADKKGIIQQPMAYWLENKKSLTRNKDNFMIDIAGDYVNTYADAIRFVVEKKPEVLENKKFLADCAGKLSQFLEVLDAEIYYKGESSPAVESGIEGFVDFCKEKNMIDTKFLNQCNFNFNKFSIFPCSIRQNGLITYLEHFGIDYEPWLRANCKFLEGAK